MSTITESFRAFRIHNDTRGYRSGIDDIAMDDLFEGDVVIQVGWSSINYKDALAATGNSHHRGAAGVSQLGDAPDTEANRRRVVPVPGQGFEGGACQVHDALSSAGRARAGAGRPELITVILAVATGMVENSGALRAWCVDGTISGA